MPAFIEMLPPDRPIFMTGQPIIRLVPSGGPGGELGDLMEQRAVSLAGRKGAPPPPMVEQTAAPAPPPAPMLPSLRPQYPQPAQAQIVAAPTTGSSFVQAPAPAPAPWAQPAPASQGPPPWAQATAPTSPSPWAQPAAAPSQYQQATPYDQYSAQQSQQAAAAAAWDEQYGPDDAMSGAVNGAFISPRDLGRLGQDYDWNLQSQLTAAAEGATPDVSAEYFRPKDVPGLRQTQEGPHTGRSGVYPKKLRDMVEFDMSGNSAFVSMKDLAGLGCCGDDGDSMSGFPPDVEAKLLDAKCDQIESGITAIVQAVNKASADKTLSRDAKLAIAKKARQDVRLLKRTTRGCLKRLKMITRDFKRELKAAGLEKLEAKVDEKIRVERTKDRLRAMTSQYGTY